MDKFLETTWFNVGVAKEIGVIPAVFWYTVDPVAKLREYENNPDIKDSEIHRWSGLTKTQIKQARKKLIELGILRVKQVVPSPKKNTDLTFSYSFDRLELCKLINRQYPDIFPPADLSKLDF